MWSWRQNCKRDRKSIIFKRRINDMSLNIKNKLLLYLKAYNFFARQTDKSTDVVNIVQLLTFIRFDRTDEIIKIFFLYVFTNSHNI